MWQQCANYSRQYWNEEFTFFGTRGTLKYMCLSIPNKLRGVAAIKLIFMSLFAILRLYTMQEHLYLGKTPMKFRWYADGISQCWTHSNPNFFPLLVATLLR